MYVENTSRDLNVIGSSHKNSEKISSDRDLKKDSVFTIDLHDPNAPPEAVIETMSSQQKTWLGSLLRPYDMLYHIFGGAYNKLNESYQQKITETLKGFENSFLKVQCELKELLGNDDYVKLSLLFLQYYEHEKQLKSLMSQQEQEKIAVDAIHSVDGDAGKNKKLDITTEYSDAQIRIMYDYNQLSKKVQKANNQHREDKNQIIGIIDSLQLTSSCQALLHILKETTSIRTPLLMQQFAFSSSVPELPGGFVKAGIQMQIVLPSNEVIKKIFTDEPINNLLLQPLFHAEAGISTSLAVDHFIPFTLKGALTGLRVSHFGVNIPIDRKQDGWHCGKIEYVIETVSRIEGHLEASKKLPFMATGLQLKVGGDTVRQFVFPCDTSGSISFFTQLALRSTGAVLMSALALHLGTGLNSAKAAGVVGLDVAGMLIEMADIMAPERIIDIVEAVTLGVDIPIETNLNAPYLGQFGAILMQRQNAALIVEHDLKSRDKSPKDIEIAYRSHPENLETRIKRRTF